MFMVDVDVGFSTTRSEWLVMLGGLYIDGSKKVTHSTGVHSRNSMCSCSCS